MLDLIKDFFKNGNGNNLAVIDKYILESILNDDDDDPTFVNLFTLIFDVS